MLSPSPAEIAEWIANVRSSDAMVRDLSASCIVAYVEQLEETRRFLSREVLVLKEFRSAVTEALASTLQPAFPGPQTSAEKPASLVPPALTVLRGGA